MPVDGYFDTVFGVDGTLTTVPDALDPSGYVSFNQGYPIGYEITPGDPGSLPIERGKMNYLFNQVTSALQQYQQNGIPPFITTTMNGGSPYSYSSNARVLLSGVVYQSLVNSNTDTPPSAKWKQVYQGGFFPTGAILNCLRSTPFDGFLLINGDSIGSAASGATHADDTLYNLYAEWWNYCSFPSSNFVAPVTGGLGASAAADFAANKRLTMPDGANRSIVGVGSFLTQVGSTGGASATTGTISINSVTLSTSNLPALTYTINGYPSATGTLSGTYITNVQATNASPTITATGGISTNAGGGSFTPTGSFTGGANGNYQPSIAFYPIIAI
jgi:hypothetical protein